MDKILVHGGHPLSGSIKVSGSKNSSLPILAATLLTRETCVVHGVPDLSDTHYMLQILMHLGAQVERASGTVTVTAEAVESIAPYDVVRKMRASVCVLGPLLGRCKEATVSMPGGCVTPVCSRTAARSPRGCRTSHGRSKQADRRRTSLLSTG